MFIPCTCGNSECKNKVWVNAADGIPTMEFWTTDKDNVDHMMYLDANSIVNLIHELKRVLDKMAQ